MTICNKMLFKHEYILILYIIKVTPKRDKAINKELLHDLNMLNFDRKYKGKTAYYQSNYEQYNFKNTLPSIRHGFVLN